MSYAQIIRLEPQVNLAKKANSIGYLANTDDYYPLNPGAAGEMQAKLIIKEIVDSAGFMFLKASLVNYTSIDTTRYYNKYRDSDSLTCTKDKINGIECDPYLSFWMLSTNNRLTTVRRYKGLLETLGEIGGLKDIVWIVFLILYTHYHHYRSKHILVQEVYGFSRKYSANDICRKKAKVSDQPDTLDYKVHDDLVNIPCKDFDAAYDQIERSLDVVSLARELTSLRFLLVTLLNPKSRAVLPSVMCVASQQLQKDKPADFFLEGIRKSKKWSRTARAVIWQRVCQIHRNL